MKKSSVLMRINASLLLLLLVISIAPKSFFHDLIADHTDKIVCHHSPNSPHHFHQYQPNCHFDNLVVTLPYLSEGTNLNVIPAIFHTLIQEEFVAPVFQLIIFHKESRGPPSMKVFV